MSLFTETGEIDPSKDYFSELVGEGKKYKTQQDAGRALAEGPLYVKQLEREASEARAALAERVKLEELLDKINSKANQSPNSDADNQNTNGTNTQIPVITPEQIDELFNKKFSQAEQERQAQANESLAREIAAKKFGNNYPSKLKEEASKVGMTPEQLDQVARTNPSAFSRLIGADTPSRQEPLVVPPTGVSTTFKPATGERTMAWYKELRKKDPVLYASREMVAQQHKDAERIGESFFDV